MTSAPLSLLAAAREHPSRIALLVSGAPHTFAALAPRVAAACARLEALGLPPAARVAVSATNRVETAVLVYALLELGLTFVPLHPRLTDAERDALALAAEPALVLRDADLSALCAPLEGASLEPRAPARDDAVLAMLFTSGTTGRPKGALLARGAFLASARGSEANFGWREDDRWLLCMPVCHVGGLSILTRCLVARRTVVLEPRFDPDAVLASLSRDRVTLLSVVPTMLRALLERDAGSALSLPRAVLVGGAACPLPLLEQCATRRVRAVTTYGLTEACSQVTTQRLREGEHFAAEPGSGAPLEGVALSVVDDAGRALPPDTVGRIRVRGPTLMQGYFRHEPLAVGAWLETGDLGALDREGRLFVHARRTDLVVSGGENVYPAEVEQALEACPGVAQALVFGVADERWGQRVAAVLVPSDAARGLDERAVYEALAARLAGYKRPKSVCVVDALPLLGNGKVDRAGAVARFSARLRPWGPSA